MGAYTRRRAQGLSLSVARSIRACAKTEHEQMMQTTDTNKQRAESMKSRQSRQRIRRWQKIAGTLARTNPSWNGVKIAHRIQRSAAGRKRNGSLTYSIDFILRNIRSGTEISL
jgi:hypothetical protein